MFWGKNVTNAFYVTNRDLSFDGVAQYIGLPLTYGVTFSVKISNLLLPSCDAPSP